MLFGVKLEAITKNKNKAKFTHPKGKVDVKLHVSLIATAAFEYIAFPQYIISPISFLSQY